MATTNEAISHESYRMANSFDEEAVLEAAGNGDISKLSELHKLGTNFKVTDSKHRTAIHNAVCWHFSTVKYLVEEIGLDPNLPDVLNSRPVQWAASVGQIKTLSYLLDQCGSSSNDRDMFGDSAVEYAAYNGHTEVVKLLAEQHHADVTFVNQRGATAADDAETRGHPALASYLRECAQKQKYMLLKDCSQKRMFSKFRPQISNGEILTLNRNNEPIVCSSDPSSAVCVRCDKEDYCCISPRAAELLLAMSNCQQRYSLFMDRKSLLHKAMNLSLGDTITVKIADNPQVKCVIKYRGSLKDCDGLFYGVQLQEPIFSGATDGSYKGTELFTCPPNCGVFIALECLL